MWKPQTKDAVLREIRIREWRKQVAKAVVATLKWLLVTTGKEFIALLKWLKWQSAKVSHELELNRLISQRHDKLVKLGETVYALYRSGEISQQAVELICREIEQLDKQLETLESTRFQVLPYETGEPVPSREIASR
ncbi:MAG: hypothetical protein ACUVTP_10605 [Candidatus Fervidibacter sp.]|uniref:hypothetical protein n=1 Tax=Candidatus Fervidibacter sp. TaxID=3100871 RepID=UPI00404993DF